MKTLPITTEPDKPDVWLTRVRAEQFLKLAELYGRRQAIIDMLLASGHRHMDRNMETDHG